MRDLTQEEIDLAPDWATYYHVENGGVYFTDAIGMRIVDIDMVEIDNSMLDGKSQSTRPIPRKPFDISEHVFSDRDFNILQEGDNVLVEIDCDRSLFGKLNKADAIAIAKALGVAGGDL